MNRFMFGFCALIISSCLWPSFPEPRLLPWLLLLALLIIRFSSLLAGALFACAWLSLFCQYYAPSEQVLASESIVLKGEIISLVRQNGDSLSLDIRWLDTNTLLYAPRIKLYWPKKAQAETSFPTPAVGQVWHWHIKPKSIVSVLNQGGFNQQRYRVSQHIVGRGRVTSAEFIRQNLSIRQSLILRLLPITSGLPQGDILQAITLGDKQLITAKRWQQLRETGTGHLIAISGLHLSVVAIGCYWLLSRLLIRCSASSWWSAGMSLWLNIVNGLLRRERTTIKNIQEQNHSQGRGALIAAAVISGLICGVYSYFAGFSIATQRALIMLVVLIVIGISKRHASPWERLLWAMFLVLFLDPVAVLSAGFWLSFLALAIILYTLNVSRSKVSASGASQGENETLLTNIHRSESAPSNTPKVPIRNQALYEWLHRVKANVWLIWAVQWRLSLGLGLAQGLLFGGMSGLSLAINILVVPWFSLVAIPVCLIFFVLWCVGGVVGVDVSEIFFLANMSLVPLDWLLQLSELFPLVWIPLSDEYLVALLFFCLGGLLFSWTRKTGTVKASGGNFHRDQLPRSVLLQRRFSFTSQGFFQSIQPSWQWVSLLMAMPFIMLLVLPLYQVSARFISDNLGFFYARTSTDASLKEERFARLEASALPQYETVDLDSSHWQLHLLDVGQGLSLVIERQGRGIMYDTGAAFGKDFSYAERVVLPFLRARGITHLDTLIISHSDNDHAGGRDVILKAFPETQLVSDGHSRDKQLQTGHRQGKRYQHNQAKAINCRPKHWYWQGLHLELLGPSQAIKGNNGSCVLRVSDTNYSVLIPGDIESEAEADLLAIYRNTHQLKSDVLIAPHHGSRTSSTDAFVQTVSPQIVLFPAGFANRYGFPKPDIVDRYSSSLNYVTGESGQISVSFKLNELEVSTYRDDLAPFWYNRLFGFGTLAQSRVE